MSQPNTQPAAETSVTRPFADRVLRLLTEREAINEVITEVYDTAKAAGLDVAILKGLVKSLGKDASLEAERAALLETYKADYRKGGAQ